MDCLFSADCSLVFSHQTILGGGGESIPAFSRRKRVVRPIMRRKLPMEVDCYRETSIINTSGSNYD